MFKYFLSIIMAVSVLVQAEPVVPLIVPSGPGGLFHTYSAEFEPMLSAILDKNVVIEFHPGGQGLVGAQILASNKKPNISMMITSAQLQPDFGVDQQKDIIPVLYLGVAPTVLITNKSEMRDIKDVVRLSRKLNVGFANGASLMYWLRQFKTDHPELDINEIPYKSGQGVLIDVANGNLDLGLTNAVGATPLIQDNRMRALAVLSTHRSALLPTVPTTFEQGVQFDTGFAHLFLWTSPGITPADIIKIQKEFVKWAKTNEGQTVIKRLDLGFDLEKSTRPTVVMDKILKNK